MLAQIEALKDTPYYAPLLMIVFAFVGAAAVYTWMRAAIKPELAAMQKQIDSLNVKVERLEDGRNLAAQEIVMGLGTLHQTTENEATRNHLEQAVRVLLATTRMAQ